VLLSSSLYLYNINSTSVIFISIIEAKYSDKILNARVRPINTRAYKVASLRHTLR
jgi:hypothetical protein